MPSLIMQLLWYTSNEWLLLMCRYLPAVLPASPPGLQGSKGPQTLQPPVLKLFQPWVGEPHRPLLLQHRAAIGLQSIGVQARRRQHHLRSNSLSCRILTSQCSGEPLQGTTGRHHLQVSPGPLRLPLPRASQLMSRQRTRCVAGHGAQALTPAQIGQHWIHTFMLVILLCSSAGSKHEHSLGEQ